MFMGEFLVVDGRFVFSGTHDTFGANVAIGEIAVAELADGHALRRRRMGKVSVSDVDSDMGYARAARIEEYQISGTQIAFGDGSADFELCAGLARNGNA